MKKLILFALLISVVSCTRSEEESSKISIKTPNRYELQSRLGLSSIPTDKKVCYAISVTGPDIPSVAACGEATGAISNFVAEGQELSIEVLKGSNRNFKLYAYYIDPSSACGVFDFAGINAAAWGDTYSAGGVSGISLANDQEYISIPLSISSTSIGAASGISECASSSSPSTGAPQMRAMLYSSGDIVNASLEKFAIDYSNPTLESISYVSSIWNLITNAYELIVGTDTNGSSTVTVNSANLPPEVRSLSRKPDTGEYYGMLEDGQVVQVDATNGSYSSPSTCPFTTCQVPEWIQSISVGNGDKLYALDHAGNLYEVQYSNSQVVMVDIVAIDPAIAQVSYY